VVVDMVPFFLTGNAYARGIVPNIARLATALRSAGGTVCWVLPSTAEPPPVSIEFFGPTVAELYRSSGGEGPLRERLWYEFDVHPGDLLVQKSSAGAFFPGRCDLHEQLHHAGIDTVLVVGTVANVCCESTARDASTQGYRVIMIADANAATRDRDLNSTLHTIYRSFGDVRPTAEVVEMIETGT